MSFLPLLNTIWTTSPPGCKLSFIVVDFVVSKQHSVEWHRARILELMDLLHSHHAGNVIRFGLVFVFPSLCTPDTFKNPLKLAANHFPLVRGINKCISYLMTKSCSRSTFGSINKHVGITVKGKNWKSDAWEGFNPAKPSSIIRCSKLTPPYQKRRSFSLINAIESEVRALPDVWVWVRVGCWLRKSICGRRSVPGTLISNVRTSYLLNSALFHLL